MNRCNKTGLTDQDFRTILDVLNMYDPNDVIEQVPQMATPDFMQEVQSAFKAVLAHVNRIKYNSDLGASDVDLDADDHVEADRQRHREYHKQMLMKRPREAWVTSNDSDVQDQYIHGLS